jgi:hypothetical protein
MLFAHNGTFDAIDLDTLQSLLGNYGADSNHWDYFTPGDTLDPNLDSDLYRLFLMMWIDHNPKTSITQCLVDALDSLILRLGDDDVLNFVLATSRCDTLWALRYGETLRYLRTTDPNAATWTWEVASTGLGGGTWKNTTNHYLYAFSPRSAEPDSFLIDSGGESGSVSGQEDVPDEKENISVKLHNVYPSLVDKTLNIELEVKDQLFVSAKLYDITGRFIDNVYRGFVSKGINRFSYDISKLPSGVYFIRLENNGDHVTEKIIIRR